MNLRRFPALLAAAALGACAPALASGPAPATRAEDPRAAVAAAVDSIFNDTLFAPAQWGVLVRSVETGETVYSRNADKLFVPASNMKIVTAAAALETLGPDYRYRTRVAASGPVRGGVLQGDLVVQGSGDPTISERFAGDVRTVFRAWADSLRAHGVTRITGAVIGDDDRFDDLQFGRGWAWDDVQDSYSAEIGALELNEGFVTVRVQPRAGAAPVVTLRPATSSIPVSITATTGAADAPSTLRISRGARGDILVSGAIPADTAFIQQEVSVINNTAQFAAVLRDALQESGITVGGAAVDADDLPRGARGATTDLFTHTSVPLREILPGFLKPSQNQIGELLLKTMGAELRGAGTADAGIAVVDSVTRAWGLPRRLLSQADGSGLSRYNLVAPSFLIAVLDHERRGPNAAVFRDALPVAGVDGTLAARMRGTPLQGNVHAKTGTLGGVRSLSGYFTTAAGEPMMFSMIVNNHTLSARDADRLAEAALLRFHRLPRAPSR
ncbi:D-alanyl-D-alanine carboxypeptidase/D-alanyl-D-alanine-endopeptidase [Longimicrobium terrae]|uniref:D-alanyl-D-alanine carboxypeptidase/D-alanyl-D-alanine-endopeptidase (Penicillin-binding protein 4) n=1 Tax=Longimicrobium terrae TaxID=1639882 RepID=A0A841H005_9BACT|nr:D-alanyl-D-alanine carboxypeptidase/D-alanyl-D-alanine-endopeptidase [Longimicrobium terrae]MBB4636707.1 D-alanyl-D-alanine carboxypeptidase/D-alanyl-D-alanine-endopeptidase (penicillin-binding protein 4) [Longimicrobium terrae]MBB6071294.1 D-alanyl-D-alanine carboxypeptidase/D-alanyl-D-alanine-endopeptidase (penicillin-binding protein 4) [Longimicrobium terrae]NNC29338.1 D-alanyl-D-alanine carboxypeptidase/D-alanyl-D-alanine-endopeptidase [Longimicrobium terrae]